MAGVFFFGGGAFARRAEYEELKAAKDLAEEDTVFNFKRKKGCQAERKQVKVPTHTHLRPIPVGFFCIKEDREKL